MSNGEPKKVFEWGNGLLLSHTLLESIEFLQSAQRGQAAEGTLAAWRPTSVGDGRFGSWDSHSR